MVGYGLSIKSKNFTDQYDVEDICKIYIPVGTDDDKKVWPFTKHGQLTTKSAYKDIVKMREISNDQSIKWKDFWRIHLPQRMLPFGWKCLRSVITVRKTIHTKINSVSPLCPLCGVEEETIDHALMKYEYARSYWFGIHFSRQTNDLYFTELIDW